MHILVDARTTHPMDLIRLMYARNWGHLWQKYHPYDTLTYALSEHVSIDDFPYIHVDNRWSIFGKKKIAHHKNGPDRILSFSSLPPIETNIPTLTHIFDNADTLYPRGTYGFFDQRKIRKQKHSLFTSSHQILVPHVEMGMELVEMYDIKESLISVVSYAIPERYHHAFTELHPYGLSPGYWIAEGTPGDEWSPYRLIQAYAQYIHEYHGTKRLVITGDLGENLRHISECIRGLKLMEYVKILGVLPEKDYHALYEYASGWIYLGGYYAGGPRITYALAYGLPILTSDIAPLREYADICIHPNHHDEFSQKLMLLSKLHTGGEKYTHSPHAVIDVYGRVLSELTCK